MMIIKNNNNDYMPYNGCFTLSKKCYTSAVFVIFLFFIIFYSTHKPPLTVITMYAVSYTHLDVYKRQGGIKQLRLN